MSEATTHLSKTLCAMRWIALISGNNAAATAIERDQRNLLHPGDAP